MGIYMSLATLKRKSNTTYKNLSGKSSGDRFIINKQSPGNPRFQVTSNPPCIQKMFRPQSSTNNPNYNTITGTGGGFSINGKRRNIGGVGQHMRMSKGLSRMKSISSGGCSIKKDNVPVWKGNGGKIGKYGRGKQVSSAPTLDQAGSAGASGKYGIACCADNTDLVKPSVLSFKGMMNARNRWVSLSIPQEIWNQAVPNSNLQPYDKSIAKTTYNNWVQMLGGNGNVQTKTQGQYIIDKIKPNNQICVLPSRSDIPSDGQPLINKYRCKSCNTQVSDENNLQTVKQRGQCNKCYSRIGGKYYPPTPFSKQVSLVPSSSNYISVSKKKNANSATQGWSAKWPPSSTLSQCLNPYSSIIASEASTNYTILKR